jgi:hypothetical protein
MNVLPPAAASGDDISNEQTSGGTRRTPHLDAAHLTPGDDGAMVTAGRLREVVGG